MRLKQIYTAFIALIMVLMAASCDHIDNKAVPRYTVRIDLGSYALWNTYGVNGMGQFRIFNREKQLPSNFPYNVNTFTGYGGVLLMMGIEYPMAYDLSRTSFCQSTLTISRPSAPSVAPATTRSRVTVDRSAESLSKTNWACASTASPPATAVTSSPINLTP